MASSSPSLITSHSISLINLEQGTTYYFIASSTNGSGYSGTSAEYSVTTTGGSSVESKSLQAIAFTYDAMGNITGITDHSTGGQGKAVTFGYDSLYRLTSASTTAASSTPYSRTYSYSSIGNITNKSDQGTYTYNDDGYNNPHAADSINSVDLSYDNVGNVTTYGSDSFGWNYRDRMTSSVVGGNTALYGYDHNNLRVLKGDGTSTTTYPNKFHNVDGATTTNHVFLPDGTLIATIESTQTGTTTNYIHADHLGGTNVITDQEGTAVEVTDYYPFGEQRIHTTTGITEARKFTGHEYDTDSDLTYAKARYYDQDIGKFLSVDPAFLAVGTPQLADTIRAPRADNEAERRKAAIRQYLSNSQNLNSYSYSLNNPLTVVDKNGESPLLLIPAFGFGAGALGEYFSDVIVARESGQSLGNALVPDGSLTSALSRYAISGFEGATAATAFAVNPALGVSVTPFLSGTYDAISGEPVSYIEALIKTAGGTVGSTLLRSALPAAQPAFSPQFVQNLFIGEVVSESIGIDLNTFIRRQGLSE